MREGGGARLKRVSKTQERARQSLKRVSRERASGERESGREREREVSQERERVFSRGRVSRERESQERESQERVSRVCLMLLRAFVCVRGLPPLEPCVPRLNPPTVLQPIHRSASPHHALHDWQGYFAFFARPAAATGSGTSWHEGGRERRREGGGWEGRKGQCRQV